MGVESAPGFTRSLRKLYLCGVILAHKFIQDMTFSMKSWSRVTGLSAREISIMERWALRRMDYNLYVDVEGFSAWKNDVFGGKKVSSGNGC